MPLSREKKVKYIARVQEIFKKYNKFFVVTIENVGSRAIQKTRLEMRGTAEILMGKKTLLRKALQKFNSENPDHPMAAIEQFIYGNTAFVFTNSDLNEVRTLIEANKVPAPARPGAIAPKDVTVNAGPTGCDPGQTSFFQVLQVPTKIVKGQIEITSNVQLIKEGTKVGPSECALLTKLNIMPFEYGFKILTIFDNGALFGLAVLDLDDETLDGMFTTALKDVAALSLALGYPTMASLPHVVAGAFKELCAVVVGLENFSFPKADAFKQYVKDPSAFAGGGGGGGGGGGDAAAAPAEEAKPAEEEVDALAGGMDMFGGGGSDY